MNSSSIDKRIRQYNICKAIEYFGYILMIASFIYMVGVVGTSEMYDEIGIGSSSKTLIIQLGISLISLYIGFRLSRKGKEWVEMNKRRLINITKR